MPLAMLAAAIGLNAWAWRRVSRLVQQRKVSPLGGAVRFVAWALLPLVLFICLFLAAIAIEESFGASVLSEPMGRATPFILLALLALAVVTSVLFAVACWFTKPG